MNLLFVLFIITILIYLSLRRYRKIFNPFTLSIQIQLLFLVIPQLIIVLMDLGEESVVSNNVILVSVCSTFLGTYLKIPKIKLFKLRNEKIIYTFNIFMVLLLIIPLIPILFTFGISFRGLREFYEYIVFSSFASFYEIIKTILSILLLLIIIREKQLTKTIIFISIILCFTGSKMVILSTTILLCTIYEEYFKVNYKLLFCLLGCVFILLVYYHYSQSLYSENKNAMQTALEYFDVYRQQSYALELIHNGQLSFFNGRIWLSSIYKFIPRFIWSDKPKDYGFAILNYAIYPEYAVDGHMPSFGLAYLYADFGYVSVIVFGLMSGALKNYFRNIFYKNDKGVLSGILYIIGVNPITIVLLSVYYIISSLKKKL